MASPQEKLAASLDALKQMQDRNHVAIRSQDLSRTHRERLLKRGFLKEVIKGWYIAARPDETPGDSTAWYASFWDFCAAYLRVRFGTDWCLSPQQSLSLHAGNRAVPAQLLVRTPKGANKRTDLPHHTSLFDVRYAMPEDNDIVERDGLRLYTVAAALVACPERTFRHAATDVRSAMVTIQDASDVLANLLEGGHSTIAGRLAGAFRNIGRDRLADDILETMAAAGYTVRETDPFESAAPVISSARAVSPHVHRLKLMWAGMREAINTRFPPPPGRPRKPDAYLEAVDEVFANDAYHSLSIEGYRVSPALIERVRQGDWNPDHDDDDRDERNALAARGYCDAFVTVKESVARVLAGESPGTVADEDHADWYRQLFGPNVTAGIVRAADLAGYRNGPVFIRRSMHVPPPREAVRDCMPAFFDLLKDEEDATVRVVLGHFIFVYIHPYLDGNGRMGRFLMNVMLAAGGYPWTIVPVERRAEYMAALEAASVQQDIGPLAAFLGGLVQDRLEGKPATLPGSR